MFMGQKLLVYQCDSLLKSLSFKQRKRRNPHKWHKVWTRAKTIRMWMSVADQRGFPRRGRTIPISRGIHSVFGGIWCQKAFSLAIAESHHSQRNHAVVQPSKLISSVQVWIEGCYYEIRELWGGQRTPDVFLLNQCKYKIMKEVGRTREGAKVKAKS